MTTSPRLDAIGVAMLSGLTLNLCDRMMMNMTRVASNRLAREAVVTLEQMTMMKFSGWNS